MTTLLQDIRYALRQLGRSPGFTITAIITLALGIGANMVVFGVLQAMVLRPLDLPHAEQVVNIQPKTQNGINVSYPLFRDIRDRNKTFSEVAAYRVNHFGLEAASTTRPVWGYEVSGQYFDLVRVKPMLGRLLEPADDDHPGASHNAVLTYTAWRSLYNSDPAIVGKTIRVDKQPYTVVGVTDKRFIGTEKFFSPGIFLPMSNEAELEGFNWLNQRSNSNIWLVARIKDGVSLQAANSNLDALAAQIAKDYPKTDEHLALKTAKPGFLGDLLGGPVRGFMAAVMLLAGLVLLAACANLGSLFAARTADRTREFAIRLAIGSSRWRVLRQILTEAVTVSIGGAVVACALGIALLHSLDVFDLPGDIPFRIAVPADPAQFLVAFVVAVVAGILFGLAPVRQIFSADASQAIKGGATASIHGRRWALRDILLAGQIALCCLVVTAAFVSLRGLSRALHMSFGFQPRGVVAVRFDLGLAHYSAADAEKMQRSLLDQVQRVPGVEHAAYSNTTPLAINSSNINIYSEDTTEFRASNSRFFATYYDISPDYFAAAGTRMLSGRDFTWHDDANSPRVAIVNQTFARKLFNTDNAVGRYYKSGDGNKWQIVGVVEDGKYETLTENPHEALFRPILQERDTSTVMLVRTAGPTPPVNAAVSKIVHDADSNIPIETSGEWQDQLALTFLPARAATIALGVFGALALLLSITGTFGLASYTVAKRIRDLSIRVALGAQAREVMNAALGRTLTLLTVGSVIGLLGGVAATKLLSAVVYNATALDPMVLFAVALTMFLAGTLSVAKPARRALKIDPARLLHED